MKKKHEHAIRVQELQGLLCGWEGPNITTLGELILEDTFKLYNRQQSSRHLLLFDNVLLMTKKKRDGSLCYKSHIACSNLMLTETIEGQPLVFHTVPFDTPKASCAFQADNLEQKRDWCLQMKEVIIKSFEAKIPIHVRDLLMSLTESNTSDASSSTMSLQHNEITSCTTTPGNRAARINRSLHASLRYDKNTAYRIHLMTNARALQYANSNKDTTEDEQRCFSTIRRNNSTISSDSGHTQQSFKDISGRRFSCQMCRCYQLTSATPSITSTNSSASLSDPATTGSVTNDEDSSNNQTSSSSPTAQQLFNLKAATLDGSGSCQRNIANNSTSQAQQQHQLHCHYYQHHSHHSDCNYSARPRRASNKLQQSPSSVSSHSNSSSLFRDDGFEDDLTSTASEHSSTIFHQHRAVFYNQNQNNSNNNNNNNNHHHHHLSYRHHHLESEISSPSIAQRVVTEIIETERSYVDDLEQIVTGYLCYLRDILEQHKELFSNLEDIYKFNKDFLFQLEECYLNPGAVAACFVENAMKFDVYTHYCTMYPQVVSTLTQLMVDPNTAQLLKERQLELNQSLPLGAYLLKPVQRILKYHILFKSLIKHTADDGTVIEKDRELINEAFSVMTNIACHINEMKKKHEHAIRVQELQGLLCGWEGPDLTTLGELILEDTFKLYNRQQSSRHLLLFDNVLLMTKKKRDGSLCYKGHIACSNLMLIETIEGHPLVFHTVPFDTPKALCAFQADNLEKKRDWCLQMKEVIIKSFEVKIPIHVRDLLMSLTKSNTSDANSSTKTSSSEAAKAIRAPNYLERKRNKQDKKK